MGHASRYTSHEEATTGTAMTTLPLPLRGRPPAEVPLPQAPLVLVVGQIRFPMILAIRNPDRVAAFQEIIRDAYPILREERVAQLVFATPGGTPTAPGISEGLIWRFHDTEANWQWRVSLAVDYIALETRAYQSRQNFLDRFRVIVSSVKMAFNPQDAQRLGVRYSDRLLEPAYGKITDFFRPEVLGIAGSELRPAAQQIVMQTVLDTEEGQILARWGQLPAGATIDPEIISVETPSWVVDLDMFTPSAQRFETEELFIKASHFAERIYTVFRWMVNDDFLRFYGGQP
jgi:uncharacterized protein (TIGR04255 family)